jgi:hypothetical protein
MKKYTFSILAVIAAIVISSFTTNNASKVSTLTNGQRWWDFNGEETDQADPSYYSIDEDNFPDCVPTAGLVYCEIKALPSQWNPEEPDLSTIVQYKMKTH